MLSQCKRKHKTLTLLHKNKRVTKMKKPVSDDDEIVDVPVSYTHLDVYKRQPMMQLTSMVSDLFPPPHSPAPAWKCRTTGEGRLPQCQITDGVLYVTKWFSSEVKTSGNIFLKSLSQMIQFLKWSSLGHSSLLKFHLTCKALISASITFCNCVFRVG